MLESENFSTAVRSLLADGSTVQIKLAERTLLNERLQQLAAESKCISLQVHVNAAMEAAEVHLFSNAQ